MASSTEEILLRVGLNADGVKQGMDKVNSTVTNSVKSLGRNIAAAISGGAIIEAIKKVMDHFDDLKDSADNLGVGTNFLQGGAQVASRDAVGGTATFNRALTELNVKLGQAKDGNEAAVKSFQKLGLTVGDIATQDTEGMFYLIADRIKSIPDPAQRTAAAFELMGKAGKNMVGVLANGSSELRKMVEAVDKLDEKKVKDLADAKDRLDDAQNKALVIGGKILGGVGDMFAYLGRLSTGYSTMRRAAQEEELQGIAKKKKAEADAIQKQIEGVRLASAAEQAEFAKVAQASWETGDKILALIRKIQGTNAVYPTVEELAASKGPLRKVAQRFIDARDDQKLSRINGWTQRAAMDQGWMNSMQSILHFYGANASDPARDIAGMNDQIAALNAKLANGVIKTQIVDDQ